MHPRNRGSEGTRRREETAGRRKPASQPQISNFLTAVKSLHPACREDARLRKATSGYIWGKAKTALSERGHM